jgi:hypothetical protein
MTARVHKGRHAGPRPSKFENGWNLRGTGVGEIGWSASRR